MSHEVIRSDQFGTLPSEAELRQFPFIRTYQAEYRSLSVSHIKDLPTDAILMGGSEARSLITLIGNDRAFLGAGLSTPYDNFHAGYSEDSYIQSLNSLQGSRNLTPAGVALLGRSIAAGQQAVFEPTLAGNDKDVIIQAAAASWQQLVLSYRPLISRYIKGSKYRDLPRAELHQHGELGLMHAATMFDYRKGFNFITYAERWIRKYANDYHREAYKGVKTLSLDAMLTNTDDQDMYSLLVGDDGRDVDDTLAHRDVYGHLARAVGELPELHRSIFQEVTVMPIFNGERKSLQDASRKLGLKVDTIADKEKATKAMLMHPASGVVAHISENPEIASLDQAACKGEDVVQFFPGNNEPKQVAESRMERCGSCAVKAACEAFAIDRNIKFGNFGDVSYGKVKIRVSEAA